MRSWLCSSFPRCRPGACWRHSCAQYIGHNDHDEDGGDDDFEDDDDETDEDGDGDGGGDVDDNA